MYLPACFGVFAFGFSHFWLLAIICLALATLMYDETWIKCWSHSLLWKMLIGFLKPNQLEFLGMKISWFSVLWGPQSVPRLPPTEPVNFQFCSRLTWRGILDQMNQIIYQTFHRCFCHNVSDDVITQQEFFSFSLTFFFFNSPWNNTQILMKDPRDNKIMIPFA